MQADKSTSRGKANGAHANMSTWPISPAGTGGGNKLVDSKKAKSDSVLCGKPGHSARGCRK